MKSAVGSGKRSPLRGVVIFFAAVLVLSGAGYSVGLSARKVFLAQEEEIIPIIAGGELDDIPALMRGNLPSVTSSMLSDVPRRKKPP
ncbi:hypothetical protein [Shimia sp. R9_3]|uniref:hypothetical protein n=1 Tax=Shimia sp. R9_3 TaxID=2821113 RepID=UPI001AD97DCE|nr:hypothetical protein [Shimia sp. R9_3]MBO9400479.1 hypothetical protein [Shimia sp. R9_3]